MLQKLLPFLHRDKSQRPQESPQSNPVIEQDTSGVVYENLIFVEEIPRAVVNRIYFFSVFLISTFIFLVFVNLGIKTILDKKKIEQTNLSNTIESLNSEKEIILIADKKLNFYQSYINSKKILSEKASIIFDKVNPGLIINTGELEYDRFSISLTGDNIYLFTQLIIQYFETDKVSEVSIVSANLNSYTNEFTVVLNGVFK